MAKYVKKPVCVDAVTFDEFVEIGTKVSDNIVNGMPWSFEYQGQPVTHENDECYFVCTHKGSQIQFTKKHVLITDENGDLFICEEDAFHRLYERHQQA